MPDIVIHDATVLTVDDRNRLFERGTILVADGGITAVRATEEGDADTDAEVVLDGEGRLAMPGLVNAHAHLELTALLGAFSDLGLGELLGTMTAIAGRPGRSASGRRSGASNRASART